MFSLPSPILNRVSIPIILPAQVRLYERLGSLSVPTVRPGIKFFGLLMAALKVDNGGLDTDDPVLERL